MVGDAPTEPSSSHGSLSVVPAAMGILSPTCQMPGFYATTLVVRQARNASRLRRIRAFEHNPVQAAQFRGPHKLKNAAGLLLAQQDARYTVWQAAELRAYEVMHGAYPSREIPGHAYVLVGDSML